MCSFFRWVITSNMLGAMLLESSRESVEETLRHVFLSLCVRDDDDDDDVR